MEPAHRKRYAAGDLIRVMPHPVGYCDHERSVGIGALDCPHTLLRGSERHPDVMQIKATAEQKCLCWCHAVDLIRREHLLGYAPKGVHMPDGVVGEIWNR